jgi:tetratricopeptide (TPR) repeat protein
MARAAISLDPNDPTVLALASHALGHLTDDYETAETLMDRALTLNPNSALAWELGGWLRLWVGDPSSAVERLQRGFQLSPLNMRGFIVQSGLATAYIMHGRYEQAIEMARKCIGQAPHWHTGYRMLAAALAGAGRLTEAREMAAQHVARNRSYTLRLVRLIYKPSPGRARLIDCMRKAGIPE